MGKSSDHKEHGISLLRNTADETWSSDDTEVPSSVPLHTHPKHSRYLLLTNVTLLFAPALPHISYETVTFQGFTAKSPYKGYPTDEIDSRWEDLDLAGYVSVSKIDLVETLGKNETYAALDGTDGQEFLGSMEVFHQLHCLNLIRKFTYEDYYRKRDPMPFAFRDSPATLRKHVDYLREAIMCAGDVGVYMSFWVENRDIPWPDFKVDHKCRSWDSIVAYANEAAHGIRVPAKPSDAVVYKHPNHPHLR